MGLRYFYCKKHYFSLSQKKKERIPSYVRECHLLNYLNQKGLPALIPNPTIGNDYKDFYMSYPLISGKQINFNDNNLINLAKPIANFLAHLHNDVDCSTLKEVPSQLWCIPKTSFEFILCYITINELNEIYEIYQQISKKLEDISTTLVHGDFNFTNLLHDDNKLVGVIDWTEAKLSCPETDLVLFGGQKSPFVQELLKNYNTFSKIPYSEKRFNQMRFIQCIKSIIYAPNKDATVPKRLKELEEIRGSNCLL